ncbi:RNase H1/viroplasmin domain-containing protein, partial [Allisonella histaminiformans]|uniref:RNase H1/viroplasmin domain-containing protein n=1 Tax=Allisonella histaminiformans TaxID=209880 RepID=UPI00307D741A
MKKKSWYAVRKGRREGLYRTWDECRKQVIGYPGASYKGFYTQEDAEAFLRGSAREPETAVYAGGENP